MGRGWLPPPQEPLPRSRPWGSRTLGRNFFASIEKKFSLRSWQRPHSLRIASRGKIRTSRSSGKEHNPCDYINLLHRLSPPHTVLAVRRYSCTLGCYCNETRSSADADNRLDAFSGQSRSTNMVPFHMLHIVSYCAIVTLSLTRRFYDIRLQKIS